MAEKWHVTDQYLSKKYVYDEPEGRLVFEVNDLRDDYHEIAQEIVALHNAAIEIGEPLKVAENIGGLVDACKSVPRILYGLGLDDRRQALVAQQAIDNCREALSKLGVKKGADDGQ